MASIVEAAEGAEVFSSFPAHLGSEKEVVAIVPKVVEAGSRQAKGNSGTKAFLMRGEMEMLVC